jgi:hypothetical protein
MMMATWSGHPQKAGEIVSILTSRRSESCCGSGLVLRLVGWGSVIVGVAAVGLFVGRELRERYKFNHRTPSDFYAHAGDEMPAEFGVGI